MKFFTILSGIITVLLLLTTMICGLWIRANNLAETNSMNFHINSGIASVVFAIITLISLIILLAKMKKKE